MALHALFNYQPTDFLSQCGRVFGQTCQGSAENYSLQKEPYG